MLEDGEDDHDRPEPVLTTVDSPGHAKHHLALHDSRAACSSPAMPSGCACPTPACCGPATPPPDFDLDQAITSLHRFAERRPTGIALAHFGLVPDPMATLEEAEGILRRWAEVAEAAWQRGDDIAEALQAAFGGELEGADPAAREKLETLNGIHSNAAGFRRWLEQRSNGAAPAPPSASRTRTDRPPRAHCGPWCARRDASVHSGQGFGFCGRSAVKTTAQRPQSAAVDR